jgi:diamine N-acetyltransferase
LETERLNRGALKMSSNNPFCDSEYKLPFCNLARLAPSDIPVAAEQLISMDPWLTLGYSSPGMSRYLEKRDESLFLFSVGCEGNQAGIIGIRYPWLLGPYLELFAIWKPFQGRGLGSAVMDWFAKRASRTSRNIWTLVSSFNENAINFYFKSGFRQIAYIPDLVKKDFSEILLRKSLNQSR